MKTFRASIDNERAVLHFALSHRAAQVIPTFVKVEDTLHDYSGSRTNPDEVASRVLSKINKPGPQPADVLKGMWDSTLEFHWHERAMAEREYDLKLAV
jgi:hypothetical protein